MTKPIEKRVRDLLLKHQLASVKVTFSLHGVTARAMPETFNPIVAKRREAILAKREGSLALDEVQSLYTETLAAVGRATADTIEEALATLQGVLDLEQNLTPGGDLKGTNDGDHPST